MLNVIYLLLFLVILAFKKLKILIFGNNSLPARNAPNQNIFEPIKRIVTAIEVVLKPNSRKGTTRISAQKIQESIISIKPSIWVFFRFFNKNVVFK
jgi:hypothetical protein